MKTKTKIWIYPFAFGVFILSTVGCKKEAVKSVGEYYGGGIIFYVALSEGNNIYHISATSDQSKSARWDTACKICERLVLNGYSDWHLPNIDDLESMYEQRSTIGGFGNGYYWGADDRGMFGWGTYCINFNNGQNYYYFSMDSTFCVRAVRMVFEH